MKKIIGTEFLCCILLAYSAKATTVLVDNPEQLTAALAKVQPGDTILLNNGEWKNTALIIDANGTKDKPIVIAAKQPGAVIFSGNSYIRFGSNYVTVSGLYFTNGYTEHGAVVEFRKNNEHLANNCRLTNCVIENFNKPERFANDHWIVLWGQHNRIDHCVIGNKLTGGTTLIVELNDERSQQNYHQVDSNYFAGRQPLGSNGGEIIRVGNARYSLTSSHTVIHHNYFEHCNGEVEIVSVKSGDNEMIGNTFFECEGGLVLRHGCANTVANNIFIGNNKPHTGGVRIINPGHKIYNNLFLGLAGERFHAAFTVLNGVPNSLAIRYLQVKDVAIHNNSFVQCKNILFGAGKDAERTLSPQDVSFTNNFIQTSGTKLYDDANKDGGILFKDNVYWSPAVAGVWKGFQAVKPQYKTIHFNGSNWQLPVGKSGVALDQLSWMSDQNTGAAWYVATDTTMPSSQTFTVSAAQSNNLPAIVAKAGAGDIIILSDTGFYQLSEPVIINKPLTIKAKEGLKGKPQLVNASDKNLPAFIVIENGAAVTVENIAFNSAYKSYGDVQAGISTAMKPMSRHYRLYVKGCTFFNFNEGSSGCIRGAKSTYADTVAIVNCLFHHNSGIGIDYSAEKDDKGIYNVERLHVSGCTFTNMLSTAINVYRGGNDESTTGPEVFIDHCTFNEVENRMQGTVLKLLGVQTATVTNCIFNQSGAGGRCIWFEEMSWDKIKVDYCNFYKSGRVSSFFNNVTGKHMYNNNPVFKNPSSFDYRLKKGGSPLLPSSDGKLLGVN
jgi:poly(beta-D-mannuronate) lyase